MAALNPTYATTHKHKLMRKLLAHLILMANFKEVSIGDWFRYVWNAIIHFAPVAYALSAIGWWYSSNRQFTAFMFAALTINAIIGGYRHHKFDSFDWWKCLTRNLELAFAVITVFFLLEMMRITVGDNIAGNSFKILIQVMSLMYPISKTFKNIFILTKGKYPPKFIMDKLYNFEKNGDLSNFFKVNNNEKDSNTGTDA